MDRYKYQFMVNEEVENKDNKLNELPCNCSLIDVDELALIVSDVAKECFHSLEIGVPISVQQFKLFNILTKRGLKLQIENATTEIINGRRNIITVNGVLTIVYFSVIDDQFQTQKETRKYLEKNNYVVGLLIELDNNHIDITKIDRYTNTH